ncbi:hypothetical protein EMCG_07258 [[Emmonsia] crescens]|uniref:glutathione-specific gamma-glutamylcyclotransferase n=1 Tax=[Emmonsia] crescens TaxID=73230 RepID=A0A0G2I8X4_9EURO|nr:hypothetical protein EMCG_07258 [Emmonsia crescens UAMH 3008]
MFDGSGSGDHRGTPESPGRVVTVIEQSFWETLSDPQRDIQPSNSNPSTVWGAAYHIPASHAEEVHAYLDDREIDGYTVHFTPFHPAPSTTATATANTNTNTSNTHSHATPITCMVYIGLPTNAQFLRNPADRDPANVARVISQSCGQSGENRDYLYLLEKALEGPGFVAGGDGNGDGKVADSHIADLARRVRAIEGKEVSEVDRRRSENVLEHLPGPEMGREERAVRMEEFDGGEAEGS